MIRFLADVSLHDAIVTGCLRREPRSSRPRSAGLRHVPDRILVTSDLRTMPRHFGAFLEAHGQCAGIFLVKHWPDVIEALVLVWAASGADEMEESDRADSGAVIMRRRRTDPCE